ncbi:MAG: sugar nucleotide-binding protein [Bacteriovorax sp.]|nr:sugar nucleotide-binding protein [Bacteriovorax sp.]
MKILIFGVGGMIGHRVWLEANQIPNVEVFGLVRKSKTHYEKFGIFNDNVYYDTDVSDWVNVEHILNKLKPDVIVNALGITIRKPEMGDFNLALTVNSFFPHKLLKWAQAIQSRIIHLSTDCVFDGDQGHYLETSQPSAKDIYGKTKFLGEIEGSGALTLRFSCIGRELESHTELLDWFLLQEGKKIKGFSKAIYSGLTNIVIAKEICRVITNFSELTGVYQLSSTPITKYDLLCLAKTYFKLDVEIEKFDNYISDKSLICDKYKKGTGFNAPSWAAMLEEVVNDKKIDYKIF